MSYSTGMMNKRIVVAKRAADTQEAFGKSGQPKYELLGTFWAAEDFNRGVKSLREGAFDSYDTVMFRMRWAKQIDRWCIIQYQGRWYQIQSFNADYQTNQIQITAIELANQQVNFIHIFLADSNGNLLMTADNKYLVVCQSQQILLADRDEKLLVTSDNKYIELKTE